jgi:hypothetical protein
MTAPGWLVGITAIASFMAAVVVSMIVSIKSKAKGDGLLRMWAKQGCFGALAMLGVWAAYFIIFRLVILLAG